MIKPLITLFFIIFIGNNLCAQLSTREKASFNRGDTIYQQYCLACHQKNGAGVPSMNPPLIKASYVIGNKKNLIQWVLHGTQEKKEMDGELYSNNMPPQSYLSDQQIADVLTFIRNSFGNKVSAVSSADVNTQRASLK